MDALEKRLESELAREAGRACGIRRRSAVGGGCINQAWRIETDLGIFFVKTNDASRYPGMFEAEARGLALLASTGALQVPRVIASGAESGTSFLLMDFVASGAPQRNFWDEFGRALARLHRHSQKYFGLDHDNYIGSLPQENTQAEDWPSFFVGRRLEPQLAAARNTGRVDSWFVGAFDRIFSRLDQLFPAEPPALVHGDLWNGNYMTGSEGAAVLIDPAVYYGHREMDLAMSKLFGGFSPAFYDAYQEEYPLAEVWTDRVDICNLYPLLVHVNLFGGGYAAEIRGILKRFV